MTFINPTRPDEAKGEAREMFARQQRSYGYVPNYAKLFGDRPDIMNLWAALQSGIRKHLSPRRFELVTLAAAQQLGSSYCSLAHAKMFQEKLSNPEETRAIVRGDEGALAPDELAMMSLARKVVRDSSSVTQEDIDALRQTGLDDSEIFDIVAVAAARAFFAKLVDGLGAEPDCPLAEMEEDLRESLTVGRPISQEATQHFEVLEG